MISVFFWSPRTIFIFDQNVLKCSKWVFLFQNFPGGTPCKMWDWYLIYFNISHDISPTYFAKKIHQIPQHKFINIPYVGCSIQNLFQSFMCNLCLVIVICNRLENQQCDNFPVNSLAPERNGCNFKCVILGTHISDCYIEIFLWNSSQMNATGPHFSIWNSCYCMKIVFGLNFH